jgi:hypothetical protein
MPSIVPVCLVVAMAAVVVMAAGVAEDLAGAPAVAVDREDARRGDKKEGDWGSGGGNGTGARRHAKHATQHHEHAPAAGTGNGWHGPREPRREGKQHVLAGVGVMCLVFGVAVIGTVRFLRGTDERDGLPGTGVPTRSSLSKTSLRRNGYDAV